MGNDYPHSIWPRVTSGEFYDAGAGNNAILIAGSFAHFFDEKQGVVESKQLPGQLTGKNPRALSDASGLIFFTIAKGPYSDNTQR